MDDPLTHKFEMPQSFDVLMNLFETAEYLGIEKMKIDVIQEIVTKDKFLKYTNVRRHYIDNFSET